MGFRGSMLGRVMLNALISLTSTSGMNPNGLLIAYSQDTNPAMCQSPPKQRNCSVTSEEQPHLGKPIPYLPPGWHTVPRFDPNDRIINLH